MRAGSYKSEAENDLPQKIKKKRTEEKKEKRKKSQQEPHFSASHIIFFCFEDIF